MNSFEKLFVNSTNRFSAAKNQLLHRTESSNFTPLETSRIPLSKTENNQCLSPNHSLHLESNETIESLMQRYEELSNVVK